MEIDKKYFKEKFESLIDENFDKIKPYLNFDSVIFDELTEKILEANNCILIKAPVALITLTNHLLERILKLSLINNEIGFESIKNLDLWETHFDDAHKRYSNLDLNDTVNRCCTQGLITKEHKKYIQKKIREQLRNGFSHANTDMILKESPNTTYMYSSKISNPSKLIPFKVNLKTTPFLQSIQMYNFACEVSLPYYGFVYSLIIHIENKLKDKHNLNL